MFYTTTVTLIFALAMAMHIPELNIDANVKTLVFVAWGLYGVIPTVHWTVKNGGFENPLVAVSCLYIENSTRYTVLKEQTK